MFRFQSFRRAARCALVLGPLLFAPGSAGAKSCRSDEACLRAFTQAEAASTSNQRQAAIVALQAAYHRLSDPRLLVSIGKLQHAIGQDAQATASCLQAQSHSPADAELQEQARDCLAKARAAALPSETSSGPAPTTSRVETKGGSATANVTNNISVNPQINVSPQVQISPQIHVTQPSITAPPTERVPLYRKWWLWTGVGLVTAAIAVGVGVSVASREPDTTGYPTIRLTQSLTE